MKIRKIYISGKITGLPMNEVIAKFNAAEAKIRKFGFTPICPLDNGLPHDAEWADHVGEDIKLLLKCDAIYLLDDYDKSEGALIELDIARRQRMPIFAAKHKSNVMTLESYEEA